MSILLIDGDVLLYRFGFRGQESFDWDGDGDLVHHITDADRTIQEVHEFVDWLKKASKCSKAQVCLSGPADSIFRYEILPTYKHNRQGKQKPQLYKILREVLNKDYKCFEKPCLEADDCLGILSTMRPNKCVVASIDKDLMQIPGWHFNWDKMDKPQYIHEEQADLFFYKQILTGDPVDGFSGIPGVGPKGADKIINQIQESGEITEKDFWLAIVEAYENKDLTEEYALKQARMAKILRHKDWDAESQKPILWLPEGCQVKVT